MYGQLDSNRVFEKSKGTWKIPIDGVKKYDISDLNDLRPSLVCIPSGLTFSSNNISEVYSVAAGTVVAVICIGDTKGIIIKYGDYYVTYGGLSISYVIKGDKVLEGIKIGRLFAYSENDYRLEVYLSFGNRRIEDMEKWYSLDL